MGVDRPSVSMKSVAKTSRGARGGAERVRQRHFDDRVPSIDERSHEGSPRVGIGTEADDAAMEHIAGCKSLNRLDLWQSRISDEGLKHVAGLSELTRLDLKDTRITDEGVALLTGLTKLEVGVVGTDVVTSTQQALHHQSSSHGIEKTKVLWNAAFLERKRDSVNKPDP